MKDRRKLCSEDGCKNYTHYRGKCIEHFQSVAWRNHPLHNAWCNMKARCKPDFHQAKNYAELDIGVCQEWADFSNFLADMGSTWQEGLTLERIDNNYGYSKDNCKWATPAEQQRNTSVSKLTFDQLPEIDALWLTGEYTQGQIAERFGVEKHVIVDVLRRFRRA